MTVILFRTYIEMKNKEEVQKSRDVLLLLKFKNKPSSKRGLTFFLKKNCERSPEG